MPKRDENKPKRLPGELLTCELCGQQPESIAFDIDKCRDDCPFKRKEIREDPRQASAQAA